MRKITVNEQQEVSGAGIIADAGKALGEGIGSVVEAAGGKGAREAGSVLGQGVGLVVEAGINLISSLFSGLFGKK